GSCHRVTFFVSGKNHGINVVSRHFRSVHRSEWQDDVETGFAQSFVVSLYQLSALTIEAAEFLELFQAKRGPDIVESKIETDFEHIIVRRTSLVPIPTGYGHPMRSQQPQPKRKGGIVCCDHAAFGSRHVLVAEETEATG